ncbi:GDSL esterase/lipase EXL3-like [Pyrus communis]|uniref:GDSL esterase/lipase EXL3-like n=1 Tax=Pyrus communis TaxID=23211 RepID=UPI0035C03F4B
MKFLSQKLLPSSSEFSQKKKFLIVIVLFFYHNVAAVKLPNNEKIPAVIVFGDSVVDSGNNNNISTVVKCNFPPYGRDFVGQRPTGRFSNGRVPSDLIAESVGVKKILPAYLDPNLKIHDLLTGVSFASGGSGYDPLTPKIVSVLSLSDQIDMFKTYINKITAAVGKESAATMVSKSIYIVCTGSNDIANTYFSTPLRRPRYDISAYTDLMVESASSFFQELYGLGARRIGVVSLPPIGCLPSQRTLRGGRDRGCSETVNQAASLFNSKLLSEIDTFNTRLPEARLVYLDVYNTLLSLIRNPTQYGFEEMDQGCCGTGNIEVSILCTRFSPGTCNDASNYIFWDSYHPSEKGYEVITPMVFDSQVHKFF